MKNAPVKGFSTIFLAIGLLFGLSRPSSANPVLSPYDYPFISEVQVVDSAKWFIELDRTFLDSQVAKRKNVSLVSGVSCTTSSFYLRFTSKPTYYSTRIVFDTAGIAVVTPGCITGLLSVSIGPWDTIHFVTLPMPTNHIFSINIPKDTIELVDTVTTFWDDLANGGSCFTSSDESCWKARDEAWVQPIDTFYPTKSLVSSLTWGTVWTCNPNIGVRNSVFFSGQSPGTWEQSFIVDEVYVKDSLQWYIELNRPYWEFPLVPPFPDAITKFMLRFGSQNTRYASKIQFDSLGIGVLSRDCITGIPGSQSVPFNMHHDTVVIIDTIIGGCERAFIGLPIDTLISGKSQIFMGSCGAAMGATEMYPGIWAQFARPSIGRPNGTLYCLNLVDSAEAPFSMCDVSAYYVEAVGQGWIRYGATVNKNARIYITLDPCTLLDSLWFRKSDSLYPDPVSRTDSSWLGFCSITQCDTADTIMKTVQLRTCGITGAKRFTSFSRSSAGANIRVVRISNNNLFLIITLHKNAKNAVLRTYSLNGHSISSIKLNNNNQKGTYTISGDELFPKGSHAVKGTCICELVVDGKRQESKMVVIP